MKLVLVAFIALLFVDAGPFGLLARNMLGCVMLFWAVMKVPSVIGMIFSRNRVM